MSIMQKGPFYRLKCLNTFVPHFSFILLIDSVL